MSTRLDDSVGAKTVEEQNPQKCQIRVLVADDHPSMQQALVGCLLSLAGVEVVGTAANGEEALQKSGVLHPDMVVADLLMPVMNGFQLMQTLRRTQPTIRLIAVSGHYSPAIAQEALAAGADAFVPKNGLPGELVRILQQFLGQ